MPNGSATTSRSRSSNLGGAEPAVAKVVKTAARSRVVSAEVLNEALDADGVKGRDDVRSSPLSPAMG